MVANNNQKIIRQSLNIWPNISKPNSEKIRKLKTGARGVRVTSR